MATARFNHVLADRVPSPCSPRASTTYSPAAPLTMLAVRFNGVLAYRAPLEMIAEHFNYVRVESSNPRGVSTLSPPRARATRNVMR